MIAIHNSRLFTVIVLLACLLCVPYAIATAIGNARYYSLNSNSQSGSSNSLKTQRLCLDPGIKPLKTRRNGLLTLSSSLGD